MDDLTLLSEAVIYCNSSKTGLKIASHDPNFIENQNNIIDEWKNNQAIQNLSYKDTVDEFVILIEEAIEHNHWKYNDIEGVSWFIAMYTDAIVKAKQSFANEYDAIFQDTFITFFKKHPMNPELKSAIYNFINKHGIDVEDLLIGLNQQQVEEFKMLIGNSLFEESIHGYIRFAGITMIDLANVLNHVGNWSKQEVYRYCK